MQPSKNIQVDGWAALPNILSHGPAHFTALNKVFFLKLRRLSTKFKWTAGRAPLNTVPPVSRCWVNFSSGWREVFQKHSKVWLGRAPQNTAQFLSRRWRTFSSGCYAAISKTFKLMAGPRSLTFSVTAQFISRRLTSVCFDVTQTINFVQMNGWSCSPKHGPAQFTVLSQLFVRMAWSFSKTFKVLAGSCSPKHGPVPFTVLKNLFVWMLCSHFKNIQVDGRAALPNIPCHDPAHFTTINMGIVLMLCRLSTTFKWTAGRAPPNTVQLNSRCWINCLSGWRKAL